MFFYHYIELYIKKNSNAKKLKDYLNILIAVTLGMQVHSTVCISKIQKENQSFLNKKNNIYFAGNYFIHLHNFFGKLIDRHCT